MAEEQTIKRTYTIPLRRGYANTPRYKRANKAVRVLKKYLVKHMKSEKVKIGPKLNDLLWVKGIKNPPSKVVVDVVKDEDNVVRAELSGIAYVDFKQQEKVAAPKGLQEKLKQTVADVKGGKKETKVETQSNKVASVSKETPKADTKVETKTPAKETSKPAEKTPTQSNKVASVSKETQKAEKKADAPKPVEKKEAPKATPVKTEAKAEVKKAE